MSDRLLTYKQFLAECGNRPKDIVWAMAQSETLKAVGEAIEKSHGIAISVEHPEIAEYVVTKGFVEALKRGELPE